MQKPLPVFIDSFGATIRIDPHKNSSGNIRLSITEPSFWDEDRLVSPARTFDIYISREAAKQLADALTFITDPVMQEILDPKADVTSMPVAPSSYDPSLFAGIRPPSLPKINKKGEPF